MPSSGESEVLFGAGAPPNSGFVTDSGAGSVRTSKRLLGGTFGALMGVEIADGGAREGFALARRGLRSAPKASEQAQRVNHTVS